MSEYIPKYIYVSFELEDEDKTLVEEFLGSICGHRVYVKTPERGEQKKLCDLALANAREKAREYSSKFSSDSDTLVKLAELLRLEVVPERIESYDISNIGAEFKTAGMIVCENGEFIKSDYRTFRIKSVDGTDDYASMREAISRRIEHLADESGAYAKRPDLILLDGGRGHVHVIRELLHELGKDAIPVFGMVKDGFHRTRALCDESDEYDISGDRGLFTYIYKIQEEVHRFTVSKMQGAKRKTVKRSILENIPGIGAEKAKNLLKHFGTVAKVKTATRDELCAVKGITLANAMAIEKYYEDKK
jgi:excinuclease ABC subunit C